MRPQRTVAPLMACRTILYTGKGGVGKTSVAAATARRCAAAGARTLVVSTDPAHSLADVLGRRSAPTRRRSATGLWGQQITAQDELERNWAAVQDWAGDMLVERGVDRISAEELTVPPGADELFALLAIKRHHESGEFDVVVVDCAPTGETLRLLSFPDVARWWLEKVFPQQGRILDAARPFARAVLDVSLPGEAVLDDVQRLVENLIAMHEILRDREHVSLRLVMNPDRMVVDEARRTFTYLNLYGFLTDAVVVNRVFPDDVGAVLRGVARDAAGGARRGRRGVRARARAAGAVLRAGGARRRDARPARRRAVRRPRRRRRAARLVHAGARRRARRRVAAAGPAVRRQGRPPAEEDRRRAGRPRRRAQAHDAACPRRSPGTARRVRPSRTAP